MRSTSAMCAAAIAGAILGLGSDLSAQARPASPPTGQAAGRPELRIPDSSLIGGLTDGDKKQVTAYIQFYANALQAAGEQPAVAQARDALLSGYEKHPAAREYQGFYAAEAGRILTAVLRERPEPMRTFKEVIAATVLSEMLRPEGQAALDYMVTHPNDGVRYLAWRAYRRTLPDVLAGGGGAAKALMESLKKAADAETSPIVMEEAFRAMASPAFTTSLPEADTARIRKELFGLLCTCWERWCGIVGSGDVESARCCRIGLASLRSGAMALEKDAEVRKKLLQAVADMMSSAAGVYRDAEGSGPAARAVADLLVDLEKVAAAHSGKNLKVIEGALNARTDNKGKATALWLGALEWIEAMKEFGVTDPEAKLKAGAATVPSTAP